MCTFESYWKWLCAEERKFRTLGGRREFTVCGNHQILISSTGTEYHFRREQAAVIWERFIELRRTQQEVIAGNYCDPEWRSIAGRNLGPWLASTVREFSRKNHCFGL
jgi:hypothetical protein